MDAVETLTEVFEDEVPLFDREIGDGSGNKFTGGESAIFDQLL